MQEQRKLPEEINERENEQNNNIIIEQNNNRINDEQDELRIRLTERAILETTTAILEQEEPGEPDLKEYALILNERRIIRESNQITNQEQRNIETQQQEVEEIPLERLVGMVNNQRRITPYRRHEEIIRPIATASIIERIRARLSTNQPDPELEAGALRVAEVNQRRNEQQRNIEEREEPELE